MSSFELAIDNNLPAIELDVWLTKDKQLLVVHGGDSGEINFGSHSDEAAMASIKERYVFEMTLEDNRKIEPGFVMPTLN